MKIVRKIILISLFCLAFLAALLPESSYEQARYFTKENAFLVVKGDARDNRPFLAELRSAEWQDAEEYAVVSRGTVDFLVSIEKGGESIVVFTEGQASLDSKWVAYGEEASYWFFSKPAEVIAFIEACRQKDTGMDAWDFIEGDPASRRKRM